jgi:hypothetical protein
MLFRALSLKQPWATLLTHGHKTIEVRRWRTDYRGELLIHAARIADARPLAQRRWEEIPSSLQKNSHLEGGIIGIGELVDCIHYPAIDAFVADQEKHLNDPAWFRPEGLFGFVFANIRPLPFFREKGNVRLFTVEYTLPDSAMVTGGTSADRELRTTPTVVEPKIEPQAVPAVASSEQAPLHRFRRLSKSLGQTKNDKP